MTEELSIDSEKVTEMLSVLIEILLWLSVGYTEETVGGVVSIVNELTRSRLLGLPEVSVTLIVQSH